jgi:hypothetical protein
MTTVPPIRRVTPEALALPIHAFPLNQIERERAGGEEQGAERKKPLRSYMPPWEGCRS